MFTKCPKCNKVLEDPGEDFSCPYCKARIKTKTAFVTQLEKREAEEYPPIGGYGEFSGFNMFKAMVSAGCLFAILIYGVVITMCIVVLMVGIQEVGPHIRDYTDHLFLLTPYAVSFAEITGQALAGYYFFLVFAVILSFGYLLMTSHKELVWFKIISLVVFFPVLIYMLKARMKQLKKMVSKMSLQAPTRGTSNPFFLVAQIFLALIFFDYLYYTLIHSFGTETNAPAFEEDPLWINLFGFLRASVWEEIAARLILIGVPFLIYKFVTVVMDGRTREVISRKRATLKRIGKILLGGHGEFRPFVVGLIVFSSIMFGFAHALGWDMWKVLPTFVSGLGFGYLFVKVGLHAAIMLHFSFNYLGVTLDYLPTDVMSQMSVLLIILLWGAAGFVYFLYYGCKMFRYFLVADDKEMGQPPEFRKSGFGKYLAEIFGLPKAGKRRRRA
jgi:hypothetical protein